MKVLLGLTAILTMGFLVVAADAPSKVTFVGHDKVTAALAKGGPLVTAPDLTGQRQPPRQSGTGRSPR